MTKSQLTEELYKYGEHPAKSWTKVEIRARILELQRRDVEQTQREMNSTTLETMTREMRKASKTKSALVTFCTNELEMNLSGNETKPQLEMKAMQVILKKAPAEKRDIVGFGRHSQQRYEHIRTTYTEYGRCVMQTAMEGPDSCDPRLKRLADWLATHPPGTSTTMETPEASSKEPAPKSFLRPAAAYMMTGKHKEAESSSSSPEVIVDKDKKLQEMTDKMEEIGKMLEKLQEEMKALKSEPPRKQAAQSDEDSMTDRSFVAIKTRTPRTGD